MVPEKSSIGEISSKISWSPDLGLTSSPASTRLWTSFSQRSLPTSQSKLLVWSARRRGTSRGSEILAKEMRRGLALLFLLAVREAAKRVVLPKLRIHRCWRCRTCSGTHETDIANRGRGEGRRKERS